jgi:hypothetical protein
LSSGEAENNANCTAVCEAVFIRNLFAEIGHHMIVRLHTDSSAARAMSQRLGPGKVKHMEVKTMFLQHMVKKKELEVVKEKTLEQIADLGTKFHGVYDHYRLLRMNGFVHENGTQIKTPETSRKNKRKGKRDVEDDQSTKEESEKHEDYEVNVIENDIESNLYLMLSKPVVTIIKNHLQIEKREGNDGKDHYICVMSVFFMILNMMFFAIEIVDKILKVKEWFIKDEKVKMKVEETGECRSIMTQSIAHFSRTSTRPCVSDLKGNQVQHAGVFEVVKIDGEEYLRNISTEVEMMPRKTNPFRR